jgi:diaminopimelate decarboxylase
LYEAYQLILPVAQGKALNELTDVAGPICESSDYLGRERALPALKRGDWIAALVAGAYGATMSSNYNGRPRAAEALVEGNTFRVIRRRETWDDLVRAEAATD